VLFGMDFEVQAGQAISLIGRNGMGKTTTVRTLMGMLPRAATSSCRARPGRAGPHAVARLGLGLVPRGGGVRLPVGGGKPACHGALGPGRQAWTLERVTLFERLRERRRQSARTLSGASSRCWPSAARRDPCCWCWTRPPRPGALIRQEIWRCLRASKARLTIVVIDKNLGEMASCSIATTSSKKAAWSGRARPTS
jgi:branched-chain amino acid transport system ATP-binding protein